MTIPGPLQQFIEKFSQAWIACMVCMVQGDLTVLTIEHAITASKTGTCAGFAVALCYVCNIKSPVWLIWYTGLFTAVADFLIHPTHFGPEMMEAVVTGCGAAALAWAYWYWSTNVKTTKR